MSSRYQKQFSIPEGFPQLLKTFSREVLRCQPPNIYKFGARYFAQLVEARQVWHHPHPPEPRGFTRLAASAVLSFVHVIHGVRDEGPLGSLL